MGLFNFGRKKELKIEEPKAMTHAAENQSDVQVETMPESSESESKGTESEPNADISLFQHISSSEVQQETSPLFESFQETKIVDNSNSKLVHLAHLAPRPKDISDTGLSEKVLLEILIKALYSNGVCTIRELAKFTCLAGGILQTLIDIAKQKKLVENHQVQNNQMRFGLSHIGELSAEKMLAKAGYQGPAPVPLNQYAQIAVKQSSRNHLVTKELLMKVFSNLTFSDELLEKVGPSLNSFKPVLIYGAPGTGKSYFCRHLNLVFGDTVLIPYSIEVNGEIIRIYDPEIHQKVPVEPAEPENGVLSLTQGFDPRWVLCQRPLIVTGGELDAEMLEVRFDPQNKTYKAPLQLKANNGILLLDDLGRQRITPKQLFNRWIVPLEERRDFLSLQSGAHFEIPFELIMLFSTNLSPTDLVDDAFLRRLGYKIQFEELAESHYRQIWEQECEKFGLVGNSDVFEYLVNQLHKTHGKPYLPCYPRDLLSIISDQVKYKGLKNDVNCELLNFAWTSYFVSE
ncbi:AAA family ATPase [Thalassotalea ponticola]|uniref:AAA family ATPase n=1 Tax=Thalassotalea ponticola TaxID=1523392 RepID=UPI0025B55B25|nr:AAA family ATPase [Thalassotalea ponticola]MDN3651733.1 AAA family ATPase [Thalassotalea ponticola]